MQGVELLSSPMLFADKELDGVRSGRITVAFRQWSEPKVDPGEVYEAPELGLIKVLDVSPVRLRKVSASDARAAGADTLFDFFEIFRTRNPDCNLDNAQVYRVRFQYVGGPRKTPKPPTMGLIMAVSKRLEEIDRRARTGAWTLGYLEVLGSRIGISSHELIHELDETPNRLKKRLAKLRQHNLITRSAEGYALTTLGGLVLRFLASLERS
jgi:hypothetical protein